MSWAGSPEVGDQGSATSASPTILVWPNWLALCSSMRTQRSPSLLELLDHAAAAAHRVAEMGDALEARVEAAQPALRRPAGEQPAEPGHAQHALREDVRHAGAARDVDVDVDRVVVAGSAGEQRQRRAVHGRQLQRRQFVADLNGVEGGEFMAVPSASSVAADEHRAQLGHQFVAAGWWRARSSRRTRARRSSCRRCR